jgi:S-sulfo-L-cysteine synthase (3-phospho-L-serine-dependent)
MRLGHDSLDAIGRTPLVRLRGCADGEGARLYAKLELLNPFGMKDRAARHMILEARRRGRLDEGGVIVESSSGTMALGVALVGSQLGHPVHIVTDPRIDLLTMAKLRALGARVHVVSEMTGQGWQSARLERLHALLEEHPRAFWPRQYDNSDNPAAYADLADELLDVVGRVDVIVGSVGSGGSLCGTGRRLRERDRGVRVVAVDAVGSAIFGQPDEPRRLQSGLGNSLLPANVDRNLIDEVHWLSDAEAFNATLELAGHEGVFAGPSSGSTYWVARWVARRTSPTARVVAIFPDRGDRYHATVYDPCWRREHGIEPCAPPPEPDAVAPGTPVSRWSRSSVP